MSKKTGKEIVQPGDTYLESQRVPNYKEMFHFTIRLFEKKYGCKPIQLLRWEGYTVQWLTKWRWYFDYRAALLKVQYPKYHVDVFWGAFDSQIETDVAKVKKIRLKKDLTTAKRMKTTYFNAIEKYKEEQSKLLIPDWENSKYLKALKKLDFYTNKVESITKELE